MQSLRRGSSAQSAEGFTFEARIVDEEAILDAMLAALGRSALPGGSWDRLLAAAQRDGRLSELAFAFEAAARGKRVKAFAPAMAAEFLFQAARFFSDFFGDELGAIDYLERAVALAPAHGPSLERIEQLLRKYDQPKKLAELLASVAQHRPRGEQPQLLRRAAALLSEMAGVDDKRIDLLQHVLRLEPGDEETRSQLEGLYVRANRFRDVVRLNEQALSSEPPPDDAVRKRLLSHIVEVYADKLQEPERAMPHVEHLLAMDPTSELGRKVAQKLVVVKGLAGRAAAALANAYEVHGTPQEVARFVTIELENTRGPKRAALLACLGALKADRMGDDVGAFEALEQALAIDAGDDDLRARYVALAHKLGRHLEAAKTLGRVLATVKNSAVKARAGVQLAEALLRGGDAKRAKAALASVLAAEDSPSDALLAAARALSEIHEAAGDRRALCETLERIAGLETDPSERETVDLRLGRCAMEVGDRDRATQAYERLVSSSSRAEALAVLAPIYEAGADPEKYARILEEQAKDSADPTEARERWMRAAEVRANTTADAQAAIATCRAVLDRFGPARDVLGLMIPLLESQRRWPDLGRALAYDAALTTGPDHARAMVRLGTLRLQRLGDPPGAIEAFGEALGVDPTDKNARLMLEKTMGAGEHRLAAARVLEPLYRRQGANGLLLKVLELRGGLEPEIELRQAALREAAGLADGAEAGRAADVVGRALADAVANDRPIGEWLERLDAAGGAVVDAKRRAAILTTAIGDREVTSDDLSGLAKRAAEAQASAGDLQASVALYRRALAYEPHSVDLLSRIDELLREQGSPNERIQLYRAALARGGSSKRKELLHRIGAIEWHDLGDVAAATETYRTALEDEPDDVEAQTSLGELYAQGGRWDDLCTLLEARLARSEGEAARAIRATLAGVAAEHGQENRARVHCARLLEEAELATEHLDAVARAAETLGDVDLERAVCVRRAETAADPREQVAWLDRLGELDERRRGDPVAAAETWKRAGQIAESAGDEEDARRLYERAVKVAPDDQQLTARLAALHEQAQAWSELPRLYAKLAELSTDDAERVDLHLRTARVLSERLGDLLGAARRAASAFELAPTRVDALSTFEELSLAAAQSDAFVRSVDEVLAREEAERQVRGEDRARLLSTRARVLGADPARTDEAAAAYRAILDDPEVDRTHVAGALEALERLIAADPNSSARVLDRRWLLEWRAGHAAEEERVLRLLDWARAEETTFGDTARAVSLYRRVLEVDDDCDEALTALTRLSLAAGDAEGALSSLTARRDRAEGPSRIALDLEIARVGLSLASRRDEALQALGAVLAEQPADPTARALAANLLAEPEVRSVVTRMLEKACDATEDAGTQIEILTTLLEASAAEGSSGARRVWLERLCDLQRGHGDLEAALSTAVRAAQEMPDVAALWDRAEALARSLSRPDEMAALYGRVLATNLAPSQARTLGERAVQFQEEWFDDAARVVAILERVLELDASSEWAFDRLKILLDTEERWDDLFALYDRALAAASGRTRARLLEDAAQSAKDFADRPDRAIDYLEQLSKLKPGDPKLASALERLYERQGRYRDLIALLSTRLPALEGRDSARTRARIAALWLDGVSDPAAALEAIEPLFGDDEGVRAPEIWPLLERVLAAAPPTPTLSAAPPPRTSERPPRSKRNRKSQPPSSSAMSVRQRTAGRLREHYERSGQDANLVRMLLVELEAVKSGAERVRRHLQIADCLEKLGDESGALEQVGLATQLEPQDEVKRSRLVGLAERTGGMQRLAELLVATADASDDKSLRIALFMRAAAIRADRIGDAPGAVALLATVLATPRLPDDDVLAAGRKLEPLLETAAREEERLDILERIAGVEPDAQARREVLGRAARLADKLDQGTRAIGLWEQCVGANAADSEALDGLVGLLERAGRNDRLVEVLILRSQATTNDGSRRADRTRVASLLGDVLGKPKEAIDAWREIERDFGVSDETARALTTLLRATTKWDDLAGLLEREASRATDEAARADLLRQLGDLHRVELESQTTAIETYARALEVDPRNPGARSGLLAIVNAGTLRADAVRVLLGSMRRSDDWHAVLELTAHRLLAAGSDAEKLAVLREAARLSEEHAHDHGMAFEAIRGAFVIAPGDEEIEKEATRLAEVSGSWQRLVDSYGEAIDGAARGDATLVARLRANSGAVLEKRLDDLRGALAAYLQVVRDMPDVAAGSAALRVAGRLAEWEVAARVVVDVARAVNGTTAELLDAYGHATEAANAWDDAARALAAAAHDGGLSGTSARDVEARVGVWHRDRRGDADAAQQAFERALRHDDADANLLGMLVELQRRHGGRPLVDSLLRLSRVSGGDLALHREAAEVARGSVRDLALATNVNVELLALARSRWEAGSSSDAQSFAKWAVENLEQLHDEAGDAQAVVDVLVQGSDLPFELDVRRGMRRRAARVALDRLKDYERAIGLYSSLFDEDSGDAEATERLAAAYVTLDRRRELLVLRERQISTTSDGATRVALRLEAASLLVELADSERAIAVLRTNLEEDPRHAPTVEALYGRFDAAGDVAHMCSLLTDQAELAQVAGDLPRAADLWSRAGVLAEERLSDGGMAEAYHSRVAQLEPRVSSLDALGRLATTRGDHAAAAQWLERLLLAPSCPAPVDVTLRLAEALVKSGEPARAAERLAASLELSPEAEALRERLAALYTGERDWERLAILTAEGAAHAPDKASRMNRLREAARLFSERCDKPESSVPLLEQARDLAPDDQSAALALAGALAKSRRFEDARSMLKSMVDAFGGRRPKERAPVHYQIARLELAMGNRARALVELDAAARIDPQNPDILRSLAELARDDGQFERAEKSYRALLVVLRRREEGGEPLNVARSEVLLELSAIAKSQGQGDRALELLESAIETAPAGEFEQERLEAALRARGDDETLVRVLEAKATRQGTGAPAAKTLAELADVLTNRLEQHDRALSVHLRALSLDPRSSTTHEAALTLARKLRSTQQYVDAATALIDRAVAEGDAELGRSILVRIASVAEHDLHDDHRAAAFYERAVDLGLRSPEVLEALDLVFERLGDRQKQARVLAMRVEADEKEGRTGATSDAVYRLATLNLASRDTFDAGVEMMKAALAADPQLARAEEALRRAVAMDPTHSRLLQLYEHIGRQPGHERALVDALRVRSELPGASVETVGEAVEVAVRIGENALAESLLERMIDREKSEGHNARRLAWALDTLANLRQSSGDLPSAIELKREAAKLADPDVARTLTFEVARIAADKLGDLAVAAEVYEGLHRLDPADREAWEPLLATYRRQGDARKVADLLASIVDFVDDTKLRARLRFERVVAMQQLSMTDADAAPLLREIVEEDSSQVDAALMLAAILERIGARSELTNLLERQIDAAKDRGDPASIASLSLRLGALLAAVNRMQARDAYYTALEWEPANRELLDALAHLLDGDEDAPERADVLERRAAVEQGPAAEATALEAWSMRMQLGDEPGAERALEVGFRSHPASSTLRERLETILRGRGQWSKVAELCVLDASARPDAHERVARLREAAAIWRTEVRDARNAAMTLGLARDAVRTLNGGATDVANLLLREHVDTLLEAGDPRAALSELTMEIDRLAIDDPRRAELLGARANLRMATGDQPGARDDLEAAFATDPSTHAQSLADHLQHVCSSAVQSGDAGTLRASRLRLAQVLPYANGAADSRAILSDLLKEDARDVEALRALANLEFGLEHWDAASSALKRLVALDTVDQTVETALKLADACEHAGKPADARGALERACTVAPGNRAPRERLQRLYEQLGAWHELADLVLEDARGASDVADRFRLLVRAGSLLLQEAGNPSASIEALEEAKALRPLDLECVALLADAYTMSGRPQEAAALLEPLIAQHKGRRARELAALYWRQSQIARYLGNTADEARSLAHALDCDAANGKVCADVALRAIEIDQLELASRALRAITLLRSPGPMSRALAYQYMGEIAYRQGDPKRALPLLQRALSEDPSLEGARELVDAIGRK